MLRYVNLIILKPVRITILIIGQIPIKFVQMILRSTEDLLIVNLETVNIEGAALRSVVFDDLARLCFIHDLFVNPSEVTHAGVPTRTN